MKVSVTQCEDMLKATFEDGNELTASDPVVLGSRLRDLGVQPMDVTMPDWRDGDIAPLTGSKIALLMVLRGMRPNRRSAGVNQAAQDPLFRLYRLSS